MNENTLVIRIWYVRVSGTPLTSWTRIVTILHTCVVNDDDQRLPKYLVGVSRRAIMARSRWTQWSRSTIRRTATTNHLVSSHLIASHLIASHRISSHRIASRRVAWYRVSRARATISIRERFGEIDRLVHSLVSEVCTGVVAGVLEGWCWVGCVGIPREASSGRDTAPGVAVGGGGLSWPTSKLAGGNPKSWDHWSLGQ